MVRLSTLPSAIRRFRREEDGVALVEFALSFPLMLLIFGVIVEGSRTFWSYHATISSVRDATRYVSRVAATDACSQADLPAWLPGRVQEIVIENANGGGVLPGAVTITNVAIEVNCDRGASVNAVIADLEIQYPLAGLFRLVGGELRTINTSVRDEARNFGV